MPKNRRPAPLGRRMIAYTIDLLMVGILIGILGAIFGVAAGIVLAHAGVPLDIDPDNPASIRVASGATFASFAIFGILVIAFAVLIVAIYHGYFIWYEFRREGQTPGKRWFGLRVVDGETDGPVTRKQAVVRDMMRYIDVGLVFPGIVAIVADRSEAKRLGDRVARTRVVWETER